MTETGTGRGKAGPEGQFRDALEEDTKEDLPLVLEDAVQQPKEGKQGASKSKSKKPAQDQIWRADDSPLYIVYIRSVLGQDRKGRQKLRRLSNPQCS